jgi:ADP-ribose pyrophosphatase
MKNYKYQTLKTDLAYPGKFISIVRNDVIFPTGKKGIYEVFQKSDFALVIPKKENKFLLIGQYRYPTGLYSIEFPQGGKKTEEETFEKCAKRELEEETGYQTEELEYLGDQYPCQSLSKMRCSIYFSEKLHIGTSSRDDSEFGMDVYELSYDELIQKIASNEIIDAPTIAAFNLYCIKKGLLH